MPFNPIQFKQGATFPSAEHDPPIRKPPDDCTFELGLVLAGAVSAGAYIAGVMDFLIQALDEWQAAKDAALAKGTPKNQWAVPAHDVVIRVISGASGGGISAAITAAIANCAFPHVRTGDAARNTTGNPLFDAWVNEIDITKFFELRDLERTPDKISSLLDSTVLPEIADRIVTRPEPPKPRPYFDDPLRVFLTVTNLRGVPYWMPIRGNAAEGHGMRAGRDHMRFALRTGIRNPPGPAYADEVLLNPPAQPAAAAWSLLARAAVASGAFPVGLQARILDRPYADYDYRVVFENHSGNAQPPYDAASPSSFSNDPNYRFVGVDGGAMYNEPQELARRVLAGAFGQSPRGSREAYRATVMVDPFPEAPDLGPSDNDHADALSAFGALLGAWIQQARFTPEEIALANAPEIYSRFLISPSRKDNDGVSNGFALASGTLGGFGGFLSWHYRVHDFLLGRYNCQQFLRQWFVLHQNNKVFACNNPALGPAIRFDSDPNEYRPIIPLIGSVAQNEPVPAWPTGLFSWSSVEDRALERIKRLYLAGLESFGLPWYAKTYLIPLRLALQSMAKSKLRNEIERELKNRNL